MIADRATALAEKKVDAEWRSHDSSKSVCPEDTCSWWSDAVFAWVAPFFNVINVTGSLSEEQLWPLPSDLKPARAYAEFDIAWSRRSQEQTRGSKKKRVGSLLRHVLWELSWRNMFKAACFKSLYYPLSAGSPMIIRSLIIFFGDRYDGSKDTSQQTPLWHGIVLVLGLIVLSMTQQLGITKYFYLCFRQGVYLRSSLGHAILKKALRLRNDSFTDGDICTMMAVDAERILQSMPFVQYIWSVPVQTVVVTVLLYSEVQWAAFAGLALLLLLVPLQSKISRTAGAIRRRHVDITGKRVQVFGEALALMRGLMLCGWDKAKFAELQSIRKKELWYVACTLLLKGINSALVFIWPVLVTLATFLIYSQLVVNEVSVSTVYATLAYFSLLRFPLLMMPLVVSGLADARIGLERIETLLCADEQTPLQNLPQGADVAIRVEGADFGWPACPPLLRDIAFQIPKESLTIIVGAVGSGKSSLLFALAGECPKLCGELFCCRKIALVGSKPWLLNATLRENIVNGLPFDEKVYSAVLDATALRVDMSQWPRGDDTLLGEQGQSISGGQRQRVALARACYLRPALALLDDPLSALDPPTASHVWRHVVLGLLANTTRVVATGRPARAADADLTVALSSGNMLGPDEAVQERQRLANACAEVVVDSTECLSSNVSEPNILKLDGAEMERQRQGGIGWNVWKIWAIGCGCGAWQLLVLAFLVCQAGRLMSDYLLGKWAEALSSKRDPLETEEKTWLSMWLSVAGATLLLTFLKASLFTAGAVRSSSRLHDIVLKRVFAAPIGWFEITPAGRTLNRFGRDMDMLDALLPPAVEASGTWLAEIISIFILVSVVAPLALLPSVLAFGALLRMRRRMQPTILEAKRLDGTLASPLYARFSDMLVGRPIIRASNSELTWIQRHLVDVDKHSKATFLFHACQRHFALRVCILSIVAIASTAIALIALAEMKMPTTTPVTVGLVLLYSMQLTFGFAALMNQYTEAESAASAVERLSDCASEEGLAKYRIWCTDQDVSESVPEAWPTNGSIDFSNVAVSYSLGLAGCVLRGVSFKILPGERVGIIGRSGSGKSSLLAALFGMARVAAGNIVIDGLHLTALPLRIVRQRLTLIPQEAVVFSGSVRQNLAGTSVCSDQELWHALELVGLCQKIKELAGGLAAECGAMGGGLSSGQRQLLCLARALLRRCAVLALDESTAHVDAATELIFKEALEGGMLRTSRPTVLSVAHRPESLTVADRILVVSSGGVIEQHSGHGEFPPTALLANVTNVDGPVPHRSACVVAI